MDRTEFLQMCQKASMLKDGILGLKENVSDDLKIIHNGLLYYPVAYELSFDKGKTIHIAVLHDLNANSIIKCELGKVEKYEPK